MAKRTGSFRRKTRYKLKKRSREKGKISVEKYLQTFMMHEKVIFQANSSIQHGMYFPRFHGRTGIIAGKQGNCYKVLMKDKGKEKILVVHPIHLTKCPT